MGDAHKKNITEAPIKVLGPVGKVSNKEEKIIEGLSWAGKLFFAGVAAYLLGSGMKKLNLPIKVRGRPEQIKAIVSAIAASKKFQNELNKPGATIESVIDKLQIRNLTKARFKQITGKEWPI